MRQKMKAIIISVLLVVAFTLTAFGHPDRESEWGNFTPTYLSSPDDTYKSARTRAIQSVLKFSVNDYLYSQMTIDGSYGNGTKALVQYYQQLYQSEFNQNIDGCVGKKTWKSLYHRMTDGAYVPGHYWYYRSSHIGMGTENEQIEYIRRGDPSGKWQVKNTSSGSWITFKPAS